MALEAVIKRKGLYRVVLEEPPEGVYVLAFDTADARYPSEDHLQDDWHFAKLAALQDYGIADDQWAEIPDMRFNG